MRGNAHLVGADIRQGLTDTAMKNRRTPKGRAAVSLEPYCEKYYW